MKSVILKKRVCLHSRYLDQNIMSHLLSKLTEFTHGNCTQEYGYILSIEKIIEIIDHEIGRADIDNIFNIKFEAKILKPEQGLNMTGEVCMIFKDGVFINIMNKQKMLIPKSKLADYTFDEQDKIYKHKKTEKVIKLGEIITAIVTAVGYNNQTYSCFGSIV